MTRAAGEEVSEGGAPRVLPCWVMIGLAPVRKGPKCGWTRLDRRWCTSAAMTVRMRPTASRRSRWAPRHRSAMRPPSRSESSCRGGDVQQAATQHPVRRRMLSQKPQQRHGDHSYAADPKQGAAAADPKDCPGPQEIELFLNAERPKVAQIQLGERKARCAEPGICGKVEWAVRDGVRWVTGCAGSWPGRGATPASRHSTSSERLGLSSSRQRKIP